MALNIDQNSKKAPGSTKPQADSSKKSFLNMGSMFSAPVNKSSSGEALNKICKAFNEIIEASGSTDQVRVLPIDTSVSGLVAPAIAVIQQRDENVAIFTLLVEHGVGKLAPRVFKANNEELTIPTTMGDVYNLTSSFYDKIEATVRKSVKGTRFIEAGQSVINNECPLDSIESLQRILHSATCATYTLLYPEETTASLANMGDHELTAHLDFVPGQSYTAGGLPIRRAFEITLYASLRNRSVNEIDLAIVNRQDITKLIGYVDLTHVGSIPVPNQMGGTVDSTQILAPHIHLTAAEVEGATTTPELSLLSLATSALTLSNYTYEQALKQKYNGESVDIHSLNGLEYEIEREIGAHQPNFSVRELMQEVAYPTPIYTIDIPECGDLSWVWDDFRQAVMGDQDAYARVYHTADSLTDGEFSKMFKFGDSLGELLDDRVVLGYYKDSQGKTIDLRHLDYLAALNILGVSDTGAAFAYGDTFNPRTNSLEKRLSDRLKIQDEMTGGSKVVTGYAQPVIIDGTFLTTLWNAVDKAAGRIRIDNPTEQVRSISRSHTSLLSHGARASSLAGTQYGTSNAASRLHTTMRSRQR